MNFVHLHVHSEYSLLDGAARVSDLVKQAKNLGMPAIAITDHGVMFGVIDFYKAAQKEGIKPIIGCEVYTAARGRKDKDADKDKYQGHLVLLAKDNQGYKNLIKIVSRGFLEGFYYKPRIDYELLREFQGGIIALSGCLAGNVQRKLMYDDYKGAKKEALELLDIFGEGNFYLELQDQGLEEEIKILPMIKKISEETGIPLVATNDVHYVMQEDAEAHDVLLCVQTAKTVEEEDRMRFPNDQFYLKSPKEMEQLFPDVPSAISNSVKIAQQCNVTFDFETIHLPNFKAPDTFEDNQVYFRFLCEKGLRDRYEEKAELHRERLEYELSTIKKMGYVEYFLIVWDFINYARENGIMVGPGRGSAAGSIVAFCLGITDIDPIKYNLIFERFLNPERISMPDIDIDFCYERRQEVINYVIEKYGSDKVAQIITFGSMKAKAAIRDVGRALNMGYAQVDAIAKKIPFDLKMTIALALQRNPELKLEYDNDEKVRYLIDTAMKLEGLPRHASTHAAGVVISKESIDEYVPLYLSDKGVSTQFTMGTIEELGLLKMDFLGLRTLTVIRDAIDMIEKNHGVHIDFLKMEYDDPKVYELLSSANTLGVFQLESTGMRHFLKNLKPDCFEDIVAGVALYRPGPMDSIPQYIENKKNPKLVQYVHESLEPILNVTYGCLVYQEQVMQIVRDLAGYTYGRSDLVRRAMGKKKMDVMMKERQSFVEGCQSNHISSAAANEIFDQMVKFAEYAFNKSHAAAYAVVAYETAYLKAYYPTEFMAALMSSVIGDSVQIAKYIRNCSDMKIEVLPPSVSESQKNFTVRDGKIRFGLLGIKNVGENAIEEIIHTRECFGPAKDVFDLINRLDIQKINKKAMEALIKAGALDCLGSKRAQLLGIFESLMESAQNTARKNIEGQISLFADFGDAIKEAFSENTLPNVSEFPKEVILAMEKEMLGLYLSDHPLSAYAKRIEDVSSVNTEMLSHPEDHKEMRDGMRCIIGGMIASQKTMTTKSNKMMAFLQVEDLIGSCEVVVFPNVFAQNMGLIQADQLVIIKGKVNFKEEEAAKIIAEKISPLDMDGNQGEGAAVKREKSVPHSAVAQSAATGGIALKIPAYMEEKPLMQQIKEILQRYRGDEKVIMVLEASGKRFLADRDLNVTACDELVGELIDILGDDNVAVL